VSAQPPAASISTTPSPAKSRPCVVDCPEASVSRPAGSRREGAPYLSS